MKKITTVLLAFLLCTAVHAQSLKVMTYNIRYDTPNDGVNQWSSRKQKVFDLINQYDPDILGVQEALYHQLTDIAGGTALKDFIGVGRDDGKKAGEFSAILFKKERFDKLEEKTFWLSESPETPGSKNWDAAITRIATWAIFLDKQSRRKFVVINTHFDHIGAEARKQSAILIKQKASELGHDTPVIITGDFNCTREEEPYKIITNNELMELIDPVSTPTGTFCSFQVNSIECRAIDYIFITNEWNADAYRVIGDNDGKHYPSDHLPVMVTLSLTE